MEGEPENWPAVAQVIDDRVRELGWRQRELAERSHVSLAVVREIQRHTVERRRSRRTLESLSVALGWEPERLEKVLRGAVPQRASSGIPVDGALLISRLDAVEDRLGEIAKVLDGLRAEVAELAEHVRREG